MARNILNQTPPRLTNFNPEFKLDEFNSAVWSKGYVITTEKAFRCPCHGRDAALPDCRNCFGTGYFYADPVKTKGLITNINQTNKYQTWSEELLGTIAVTVMEVDKASISYYDRITFTTEYSYYSENVEIKQVDDVFFCFTTYKIVDLLSVYIFISSDEKLLKTSNAHVNPDNPYCLILDDITEMPVSGSVSVYYKHNPEYHVLDQPHMIRSSWITNKETGEQSKIKLPLQAIARLSHFITMRPTYEGLGAIDNT